MKVRLLKHLSSATGSDADEQFHINGVHNVSYNVALFLIAAGWACAELRLADDRRHQAGPRGVADRRRINRRARQPPPIALRRNSDKYPWRAGLPGTTPSHNPMRFILLTIVSLMGAIFVYAALRPLTHRRDLDVGAVSDDWRAQQRRLSDEH